MAQCEVCGNDYHLSFEIITAGSKHTFDCFECAIHKLAPICSHCGCKSSDTAVKQIIIFIAVPVVLVMRVLAR